MKLLLLIILSIFMTSVVFAVPSLEEYAAFTRSLNLNSSQVAKIQQIDNKYYAKTEKLIQETQNKVSNEELLSLLAKLNKQYDAEVIQVLNLEQRNKYTDFKRKF